MPVTPHDDAALNAQPQGIEKTWTVHPLDAVIAAEAKRANAAESERDRLRRLWNRLEAAVSHHKKATAGFATDADDALHTARDKILSDYANGNG